MLMVSLTDSNLYPQARAYAHQLDTLNTHAFGDYRQRLEAVALSPNFRSSTKAPPQPG